VENRWSIQSLAYTVSIYWIFRGKVKLDRMSY